MKVKGRWTYLYRAVDSCGQTIDFLLSAKRFFRKALAQPHTVNPRTITVDKNPAYLKAVAEMKQNGELWRLSRRRQCKFLNNTVEGTVNLFGDGRDDARDRAGHTDRYARAATPVTSAQVWKAWVRAAR